MARHRMPVARAPFWSTVLAGTAAAAIVSGTWGLVEPVTVQGTAHHSDVSMQQIAAEYDALPRDRYGATPGSRAVCATDTDCAQYAYDHGWPFDEMTPESLVYDRSKPYGWAAQPGTCWVEKVHSAETAEVICGDKGGRPAADTADIGEVFADHGDCGWVASWGWRQGFDIAPAGCN